MPGEDTAVYDEVDNGAAPEESVEAIYDAPLDNGEAAEPELDETTETVQSPFEGKPWEEVAKDPVVESMLKSVEARLNESHRQRVENETRQAQEYWEQKAYEEKATQAQQQLGGWAERSVASLVKAAIDRGEEPNYNQVASIGKSLAQAVAFQQNEAHNGFALAQVQQRIPEYRPSQEIVAGLDRARRTADPKALATANIQMLSEAIGEHHWSYLVDKANEYIAEQLKLNGVKSAAATRAGRSGTPTPIGATRPGRGADNDSVLSSPTATLDQRAGAFKAKYGFDPP